MAVIFQNGFRLVVWGVNDENGNVCLSVNHGILRFAREEATLTIGDSRRILSSAARFSPDVQSTFLQVLMSLERILINKGGNNSYYLRGIVVFGKSSSNECGSSLAKSPWPAESVDLTSQLLFPIATSLQSGNFVTVYIFS